MEPFLGEIRLFPINFAPGGWTACDGRLLSISQNTALFSLLGTMYGGDGRSTFALPDLRGRTPVGMGQGAGTSNYAQGQMAGTETVTLTSNEMPAHIHPLSSAAVPVSTAAGTSNSPVGGYFAPATDQYGDSAGGGNLAAGMLNGNSASTGGSQPHENRMPFQVLSYCIATAPGASIFPQRQ
jgi:microcystin-dependent protein